MLKKENVWEKIFEKNIKKRYFLLFFNIWTVTFDPKKVGSKKNWDEKECFIGIRRQWATKTLITLVKFRLIINEFISPQLGAN